MRSRCWTRWLRPRPATARSGRGPCRRRRSSRPGLGAGAAGSRWCALTPGCPALRRGGRVPGRGRSARAGRVDRVVHQPPRWHTLPIDALDHLVDHPGDPTAPVDRRGTQREQVNPSEPSRSTPSIRQRNRRSGKPVPLDYVIVAAIEQRGPFRSQLLPVCCRRGDLGPRRPGGWHPPGRVTRTLVGWR
jgi:hypothetical protein